MPGSENNSSLPRTSAFAGILVYATLLTGVLYLLYVHLSPKAPLWQGGQRPQGLEGYETMLSKSSQAIITAADGKNVQLHFQFSTPEWLKNEFYFTTCYYRAAYDIYPRRVFVGTDSRIINFPADLRRADELPSLAWMHQHQESAICTFVPQMGGNLHVSIYRLP